MLKLSDIKASKSGLPPRIIIHGQPGIGKSTFASDAPKPFGIDCENGLGEISVPKQNCKTYSEVRDALLAFVGQEHGFKTVFIDTLDALEGMIWAQVEQDHNGKAIYDIAYGRGYDAAVAYWQELIFLLDRCREEKGAAVILVSHSSVEKFDDPLVGVYNRYGIRVHKKVAERLEQWADVILYAEQETFVQSEELGFGKKSNRALGGERVVYTSSNPSFVAKSRYALPEKIKLSWEEFMSHVKGKVEKGEKSNVV